MSRPQATRTRSSIAMGPLRPLDGKLAIVTGGSRGIGAAICKNLANKGCSIILNYTSDSSAEVTKSLAASLESDYAVGTLVVQADMGSPAAPEYIIQMARNKFAHPSSGKFQIDIIVNNAGVAGNYLVGDIPVEEFDRQYHINVRGPLLLIKAAEPYLPNDRSGRIVNLSSISSSLGFHGQSIYGGTKAALEAMTRTWARELSERCTVNAVNPGPVATDMYSGTSADFQAKMANYQRQTPLAKLRKGIDPDAWIDDEEKTGGRPAYPEEIAAVVGMICSEESSWCTGSVVCANGGLRMSI